MYEPNPEIFDIRVAQTIVTHTLFNAFPNKNRLSKEEADFVLIQILTDFYYVNYKPTIGGLLGLSSDEYDSMKTPVEIENKVLEINMSFVYLNILVNEYFSPILLVTND